MESIKITLKKRLLLLMLCCMFALGLLWTAYRPVLTSAAGTFKEEVVFRDPADSTQNMYLALVPPPPVKGLLVLLPGFGTLPWQVLLETQLPEAAAKKGYVVIIPMLVTYMLPDTANFYQARLKELIPEVLGKYAIPGGHFILGGHSLGGHEALFYTEKAFADEEHNTAIRPQFVFGVDPPLDLKRLYRNYERIIALNPALAKGSEAAFITERFRALYGGTPDTQPARYTSASSFSADASHGGNARYLCSLTLPVRLYSDPDSTWYQQQRNTPMEWTNTADLKACISLLQQSGNTKAAYVNCLGKGFLADGRRHPHALSILDVADFFRWIALHQ